MFVYIQSCNKQPLYFPANVKRWVKHLHLKLCPWEDITCPNSLTIELTPSHESLSCQGGPCSGVAGGPHLWFVHICFHKPQPASASLNVCLTLSPGVIYHNRLYSTCALKACEYAERLKCARHTVQARIVASGQWRFIIGVCRKSRTTSDNSFQKVAHVGNQENTLRKSEYRTCSPMKSFVSTQRAINLCSYIGAVIQIYLCPSLVLPLLSAMLF